MFNGLCEIVGNGDLLLFVGYVTILSLRALNRFWIIGSPHNASCLSHRCHILWNNLYA